ncbi:NAD(P)-dependent alcohol dehydrogenase [Hymenobacter setariae]|uniref:NAD(P)-dependent alcohol dehydrogenase n=1 Tax=Hymenobacter setariae TaxID=2594794 RepID=A0A558BS50_9BACT|nr:NAD(P)-dependent alcohol dehydrogenase [Hymenobacter setariae]TVT39323.1 NAD(P)-dependent alcohol dehydrogenase [Hymenobacter setariae]
MKVFRFQQLGIDQLLPTEAPMPVSQAHEVVLRVQALSLNALDLLVIKGAINPELPLPHIPICDAAGTIAAVGSAVSTLAVGDEVTSVFIPRWREGEPTPAKTDNYYRPGLGQPGFLAEYVAVAADAVLRRPTYLSAVEAATLPIAGLTAWNALKYGHPQPGETVLVHGTGGVSLFALQLAKARGCRVAITSKDEGKLARARELGADFTFNYATQPDWVEELRTATGGLGATAVLETVGGDNLRLSLQALATRGRLVIMGLQKGTEAPLDVPMLMAKQANIIGMEVGSVADFTALNQALETTQLHPVVDQVFAANEVQAALRSLEAGSHFGKICLTF